MLHGSFQNRIMEIEPKPVEPVVGMGVTEIMYSDREPYTVVKVINKTTCLVTRDDWKVVSGSMQDGSAKFEFTQDMDGQSIKIRYYPSRLKWLEVGNLRGSAFVVGTRQKQYDPSF